MDEVVLFNVHNRRSWMAHEVRMNPLREEGRLVGHDAKGQVRCGCGDFGRGQRRYAAERLCVCRSAGPSFPLKPA